MSPKIYDALIIGGGPAGLSTATTICRQLHTALVLDSGVYRNARSTHMHTLPGFDHADPADFRAKARQDLRDRYESIEFKTTVVKSVRKLEGGGGFEAMDGEGGVFLGRRIVLGTGVRDVVEEEGEGFEECWGRSIFHCLFCHGFEERGCESVGLLAGGVINSPQIISHLALMAKRLAKQVTIYTNGNESLATATKPLLTSNKITYNTSPIKKYTLLPPSTTPHPTILLTFTDGTTREEGFLASQPRMEQASPFAAQLGLDLTGSGEIAVHGFGNETSVEGCFAAGDAATAMKNVLQAVHMGGFVGAGLAMGLQREMDAKGEM